MACSRAVSINRNWHCAPKTYAVMGSDCHADESSSIEVIETGTSRLLLLSCDEVPHRSIAAWIPIQLTSLWRSKSQRPFTPMYTCEKVSLNVLLDSQYVHACASFRCISALRFDGGRPPAHSSTHASECGGRPGTDAYGRVLRVALRTTPGSALLRARASRFAAQRALDARCEPYPTPHHRNNFHPIPSIAPP